MEATTSNPNIDIIEVDPHIKEAQALINALDEYQTALYPAESNHLESIAELAAPNVIFVIARLKGQAAGCGAVKKVNNDYGEIKRVYVSPSARGNGLARVIILYLENSLLETGIMVARLETGIHQTAAISLYQKLGYKPIAPFGDYKADPLSLFMEKRLG